MRCDCSLHSCMGTEEFHRVQTPKEDSTCPTCPGGNEHRQFHDWLSHAQPSERPGTQRTQAARLRSEFRVIDEELKMMRRDSRGFSAALSSVLGYQGSGHWSIPLRFFALLCLPSAFSVFCLAVLRVLLKGSWRHEEGEPEPHTRVMAPAFSPVWFIPTRKPRWVAENRSPPKKGMRDAPKPCANRAALCFVGSGLLSNMLLEPRLPWETRRRARSRGYPSLQRGSQGAPRKGWSPSPKPVQAAE